MNCCLVQTMWSCDWLAGSDCPTVAFHLCLTQYKSFLYSLNCHHFLEYLNLLLQQVHLPHHLMRKNWNYWMTQQNAANSDVDHVIIKILNLNAVIYYGLIYSQLHPVGCSAISLLLSCRQKWRVLTRLLKLFDHLYKHNYVITHKWTPIFTSISAYIRFEMPIYLYIWMEKSISVQHILSVFHCTDTIEYFIL